MTVKEYLSQAWRVNRMINAKLEQVYQLRELAIKATSSISILSPGGTRNNHRMEDVIVKLMDMENELNRDIEQLVELKQEIMAAVRKIQNDDYRTLLELRYLTFMSWGEIAENMRYSRDYIFELHRKALTEIRIPEKTERPQ